MVIIIALMRVVTVVFDHYRLLLLIWLLLLFSVRILGLFVCAATILTCFKDSVCLVLRVARVPRVCTKTIE